MGKKAMIYALSSALANQQSPFSAVCHHFWTAHLSKAKSPKAGVALRQKKRP
jgi:hypothetical protein